MRIVIYVIYKSIRTCDDPISEEDLKIFSKSGAVVIPARRTLLTKAAHLADTNRTSKKFCGCNRSRKIEDTRKIESNCMSWFNIMFVGGIECCYQCIRLCNFSHIFSESFPSSISILPAIEA
jgi:hypothetical protein